MATLLTDLLQATVTVAGPPGPPGPLTSTGVGTYFTRTYTGDGTTVTYTVTSGTNVNNVIVTENGIVQTPTTDYTISGPTLTFTTAPASEQLIQIRELFSGIIAAVGGNNDRVFFETDQVITADYEISDGKNAMTVGPVIVNDGITVTVPTGSRWIIV